TGKKAFYVGDLGKLVRNNIQWQNVMAPIKPFYPCFTSYSLLALELCQFLLIHFHHSNHLSKKILSMITSTARHKFFLDQRNCKSGRQDEGSSGFTCADDVNQLPQSSSPSLRLLLHIATEDITAGEEMNMKFGTTLKNCRHLMECAKELGVQIVGVKFHVSGSCKDLQTYIHAISDARCVFDMAEEFGFKMNMLDIGGGFTGSELQLEEVNHVIRPLLDVYFPKESGVNVIAEPGCYYVSSAFTLAVNVIAKKTVEYDKLLPSGVEQTRNDDEPVFTYYINDGVYGSFASKLSEKLNTIPEVHKKYKEDEPLFASSLWGPSCDELDQIVENCLLPELSVGDWLIFDNMGSGTLSEQSTFNDYQRPLIYYMMSFSDWDEMQDAGIASDTLMKNFFFVPSCIQLSPEERFSTAA
ncbi:AZIN1 inhibitor, partial [Oxylabes madagascariensis]|nr:AZIN1 inhibitor [Oxylabes madagascariensis]